MPQYSETAIFEAVVNAVVHRDYAIRGSRIRLSIFSDRLELQSSGALPNTLTVESMALRQATRNQVIASLMGRMEVEEIAAPRTGATSWSAVGTAFRQSCARPASSRAGRRIIGWSTTLVREWLPADRALALELSALPRGGSVIFPEATGRLPGLKGRLNPTRDALDRTCLYASNISIGQGRPQPVHFVPGEELRLTDSDGAELLARMVAIVGRSALVEYRMPEA